MSLYNCLWRLQDKRGVIPIRTEFTPLEAAAPRRKSWKIYFWIIGIILAAFFFVNFWLVAQIQAQLRIQDERTQLFRDDVDHLVTVLDEASRRTATVASELSKIKADTALAVKKADTASVQAVALKNAVTAQAATMDLLKAFVIERIKSVTVTEQARVPPVNTTASSVSAPPVPAAAPADTATPAEKAAGVRSPV